MSDLMIFGLDDEISNLIVEELMWRGPLTDFDICRVLRDLGEYSDFFPGYRMVTARLSALIQEGVIFRRPGLAYKFEVVK